MSGIEVALGTKDKPPQPEASGGVTDYEKAKDTLRIARNWMIKAAEDLENLNDCTETNHARKLRAAAGMITDWRNDITRNECPVQRLVMGKQAVGGEKNEDREKNVPRDGAP